MKKFLLETKRTWNWKVFLVLIGLIIPAAFAIVPFSSLDSKHSLRTCIRCSALAGSHNPWLANQHPDRHSDTGFEWDWRSHIRLAILDIWTGNRHAGALPY